MKGEVAVALFIPCHVADEGMDVEIGIIRPARLMLEQGRNHLACRLGHLLIGEMVAPIPHRDLRFKPTQLFFDRGIKFDLHPVIESRRNTHRFGRAIGKFDVFDFRSTLPLGISAQTNHVALSEGNELFPRNTRLIKSKSFGYFANELPSMDLLTFHEIIGDIKVILKIIYRSFCGSTNGLRNHGAILIRFYPINRTSLETIWKSSYSRHF